MEIVKSIKDYKHYIEKIGNKKIGLIPTMGALHQGHISLIHRAKKENDVVVCSIFVNEIQFNNKEDYKMYPKTEKEDIKMLELANCEVLFLPNKEEIYTEEFNAENVDMTILEGLDRKLEGKFRIGHFEGVVKIVEYFLLNILPDRVYFGEKDFQQYKIIDTYVKNKKIPVEVIMCPIFREKNGLAMSSRNSRLSNDRREQSALIYNTIKYIKDNYNNFEIRHLLEEAKNKLNIEGFELEYLEIAEVDTLKTIDKKIDKKLKVFIAVMVDGIRLIDNMNLN